jgi:enoyl-CoA hydratase/carnithine racemase
MDERVTCRIDDGVADVRLNRPEKMNALDAAMFRAIVDTGERLKHDRSVRAVVLSGEGRAFCAGLDMGSFQKMADQGAGGLDGDLAARPGERITNTGQHAAYVWFEMPAPVIAAVHGVAFGGGLQIAVGADMRIVSPDAKLSVMEARWGLNPDMTGTQLLPRLVGLDVAKELTFTARIVSGAEAVTLGLATRVADDPRAEAFRLARGIADKNPHAIRGAKALLNMAGTVSLADGFEAEERTIRSLIGSPNQVEAVMANLEKRAPRFED